MSDEPELLEQDIARLCALGTKLTISKEGSYTFKRNCLQLEANVWYHFLHSCLLPTLHIQTVSRDRAFLLYCLLEGKAIDVDELVYRELCACLKTNSGNLWFLALITELCRNAGVSFRATEERLKLSAPITPATIQCMFGMPPSASKPKAGPSSSPTGPSSAPASDTTSEGLIQQVTDLQQQFATLLLQQQVVWQYMAERDTALAANLMTNVGRTPLWQVNQLNK